MIDNQGNEIHPRQQPMQPQQPVQQQPTQQQWATQQQPPMQQFPAGMNPVKPKKKKKWPIVLVIVILLLLAALLVCYFTVHIWSEPTCTKDAVCKVCGKTGEEASGHNWKKATCEDAKKCKICGDTRGDPKEHDWEDATCEEPKTCKDCGETKGKALDHMWSEPTCTAASECFRCGEVSGSPLGHLWMEATYDDPKTCYICGITDGDPLEPERKEFDVGIAIYSYNDNFMTLYRQEMMDYFETLNTDTVKYNVDIVDGNNDINTQSFQIDTFIAQDKDVIILNLVQTSSADVLIDKITAAGIPLVLINREPMGEYGDESYTRIIENPTVCYVGADSRQAGYLQGEIVRELPNQGDMDGDGVVRYVMIVGDPEDPVAQYRTEYSIKALTDAGIEVDCLDQQIGNWATSKGNEIAADALSQYGDKIDVIFCNNDGMALGAYAAIEAAGRVVGEDICLVGIDALEECQMLVQDGTMTGTVLNDHIGQSHAAVDAAVAVLNGEDIQNYYWVDYLKVDASYFG